MRGNKNELTFFDDWFGFYEPQKRFNEKKFDTYEYEGDFFIEIMLPGYQKEDIKIDYDEKIINVRAERLPNENHEYIQKNSHFGKINEQYRISFEPEEIAVNYINGVLRLHLKKKKVDKPKIKF